MGIKSLKTKGQRARYEMNKVCGLGRVAFLQMFSLEMYFGQKPNRFQIVISAKNNNFI